MANTIELPTGALGVDYSSDRPDPHELAAAGVRFVCRYLASMPNKKVIDAGERDRLWDAGLAILLNWEQSTGDFLVPSKGSSQGSMAADEARALGYPSSLPIIVSCDEVVPASAAAPAEEYFAKFRAAAGGYRLGVYAESAIANALVAAGLVDFVWAPAGWSHGLAYTQLDLVQHPNSNQRWPTLTRFGKSVDIDVAQNAITAWSASGAASPSAAPTPPAAPTAPTSPATPAGGRTYTVRAGDSWWHIAEAMLGHGTRAQELASFNGRSLASIIHPGDVLRLPPA